MSVTISEPTPVDPALLKNATKPRGELRLAAEALTAGQSITLTGTNARARASQMAAFLNREYRKTHGKRLPRPFTSRFLGVNDAGEQQAAIIRVEGV